MGYEWGTNGVGRGGVRNFSKTKRVLFFQHKMLSLLPEYPSNRIHMKLPTIKRTVWLLLATALLLPYACEVEETPDLPDEPYTEVLTPSIRRVEAVTSTMTYVEEANPFMKTFCREHGTPLWEHTLIMERNSATYYFVPLYKDCYPNDIRTIWFFQEKDRELTYAPIQKDNPLIVAHGQTLLFDYLAWLAFGRDNASGYVFKESPATRSYHMEDDCVDAYVEVGGYLEYKGTTCVDPVWTDIIDFEANGGGGTGPGDIGGAGGSGTDVPVGGAPDTAPNAARIFQSTTMTTEEWEKLESMLNEIMDDCLGGALYSAIQEKLKGKKCRIDFPDGVTTSSFIYEQTRISISSTLQSHQLFHEMWHLYQAYGETSESFEGSLLNQEIEAHYAQYLYIKGQSWYKGSKEYVVYHNDSRLYCITSLDYYFDNKGYPTKTEDTLRLLWDKIIDLFRKHQEYGKMDIYQYDSSRDLYNNFINIQRLMKDC